MIRETQLWQPKERTGAWRQKVVDGESIKDGRVAPGPGRVSARPGGECYPAFEVTDASCTKPATWFNPTPEFLASAPRYPAAITAQLRAEAVAVSEELAPVVELRMIGVLLSGNPEVSSPSSSTPTATSSAPRPRPSATASPLAMASRRPG